MRLKIIVQVTFVMLCLNFGFAQTNTVELQVEYRSTPLGIDIETPRFSWQMVSNDTKRGIYQTAYQIMATDEKGTVVWDSGKASNYETSNELVNKLWENITWSLRGNFLSIPTDTPARNERMGWSGDINLFSKASTYLELSSGSYSFKINN